MMVNLVPLQRTEAGKQKNHLHDREQSVLFVAALRTTMYIMCMFIVFVDYLTFFIACFAFLEADKKMPR